MRKAPFWVVWAEGGGTPTVMHDTPDDATKEAERLARNNRGKVFHVLQSHGARVVDDMQKIDMRPNSDPYFDDGIPF